MEDRLSFPLEITKRDDERRMVFGFAKFSEDPENRGYLLIDKQDDVITPEDLEDSAYEYVLHSRDSGEMHVSKGSATLVESVVITPEKLEAWGLKGDSVPIAWWTGYHVHEVEKGQPDPFDKIKKGEYTAFSVEGLAARVPVTKSDDGEEPAGDEVHDLALSAEEVDLREVAKVESSALSEEELDELFAPASPAGSDDVVNKNLAEMFFDYISKHKAPGHPESAHGNRLFSEEANPMGELMKELKTRFKRVDSNGLRRLAQRFRNSGDQASALQHDQILTELVRRNVAPSSALDFKTKRFEDRRDEIIAAITVENS